MALEPSRAGHIPCGSGEHDRARSRRLKPIAPAGSEATEGSEAEREAPVRGIPAVAVAGAYYILHLRESTPGSVDSGQYSGRAGCSV